MKHSSFQHIKLWLWLSWLVFQSGLCAQDTGFRAPTIPPRQPLPPPTQENIAEAIVNSKQAEKLAALADNDPLLQAVYLSGLGGLSKDFNFVEADMIRRGDISRRILLKIFQSPPRKTTRQILIHWIRDNPWIDPESFLPAVRLWFQESEKNATPNMDQHEMIDFLTLWGYPEDESILNQLGVHPRLKELFQQRLQRIRNGDNKSNPYLPDFAVKRNQTLDQVRASIPLGLLPAAKTQIPTPPQPAVTLPVPSWDRWIVAGALLAFGGWVVFFFGGKKKK